MVKKTAREASVIEIIESMVRSGEPEKKIIESLQDLGVQKDQAKKLLLLGEANTFALLKSEIKKMVANELEKEEEKIRLWVENQTSQLGKKKTEEVLEKLEGEMKGYEKNISNNLDKFASNIRFKQREFQGTVQEDLSKMTGLVERIKLKLNQLGKQLGEIQQDVDEAKLRGVGTKNKYVSWSLLVLGLAFCFATIFLFFTEFRTTVSVDSMIITVTLALIGITMLFLATIL